MESSRTTSNPTAGEPRLPTANDLNVLLRTFAANNADRGILDTVQKNCENLFSLDYDIAKVDNSDGALCANYPPSLIILLRDKHSDDPTPVNNAEELTRLFRTGKFARVRSRFAIPVILHGRTNICRSGTLAKYLEMRTREILASFFRGSEPDDVGDRGDEAGTDRRRLCDIELLKALRVKYICDLMVEGRKSYCGIAVTSSEKVDKKARYNGFVIASTPYPGVEWFKAVETVGTVNWSQGPGVDAKFTVCDNVMRALPSQRVSWTDYRTWDLGRLTANYLQFYLDLVRLKSGNDDGILVHCISGWDRTPLFISLLRLVLWADGEIHQSLDASQILYLTIAYDWMLFGHLLSDRLSQGQEIFLFCFMFLKFFMDKLASPKRTRSASSSPAPAPAPSPACAPTAGGGHPTSHLSPTATRSSSGLRTCDVAPMPGAHTAHDGEDPLHRHPHGHGACLISGSDSTAAAAATARMTAAVQLLSSVCANAEGLDGHNAAPAPAPAPAESGAACAGQSGLDATLTAQGGTSTATPATAPPPASPARPTLTSADLLAASPSRARGNAAVRAVASAGPVSIGFSPSRPRHVAPPLDSPIDPLFSPDRPTSGQLSSEASPASVSTTSECGHASMDLGLGAGEGSGSGSGSGSGTGAMASAPIPIPRGREARCEEAAGSWQMISESLSLNSLTDQRHYMQESPKTHTIPEPRRRSPRAGPVDDPHQSPTGSPSTFMTSTLTAAPSTALPVTSSSPRFRSPLASSTSLTAAQPSPTAATHHLSSPAMQLAPTLEEHADAEAEAEAAEAAGVGIGVGASVGASADLTAGDGAERGTADEPAAVSVTISSTAPSSPDARAGTLAAPISNVTSAASPTAHPLFLASDLALSPGAAANTSAVSDADSSVCVVPLPSGHASAVAVSPVSPAASCPTLPDQAPPGVGVGVGTDLGGASMRMDALCAALAASSPACAGDCVLSSSPVVVPDTLLSSSPASALVQDLISAAREIDNGDTESWDDLPYESGAAGARPPAHTLTEIPVVQPNNNHKGFVPVLPHGDRSRRLAAVHEIFMPLYRDCVQTPAAQQQSILSRLPFLSSLFKPSAPSAL